MKVFLGIILLSLTIGLLAQDKPAPKSAAPAAPPQRAEPQARPAQPTAVPSAQGRVQTQQLDQLHRHPKPAPKPPGPPPPVPPRQGHHWRWHSHYHRWVIVPVNVAPQTVILPATYALPRQVEVYQTEAVQAGGCSCPWCGKPIQVIAGQ